MTVNGILCKLFVKFLCDILWEKFGKNLKKYRLENGFTQEQFAELTNLSVTYISLLENGRANATLLTVEKISAILKIDFLKLFE